MVAVHRRAGAYGRAQVILGVLAAIVSQVFFLLSSIAFPLAVMLAKNLAKNPFRLKLAPTALAALCEPSSLF